MDEAERGDGRVRRRRDRRRAPRKATPDYLERAALYYLERFASSAANLRRVLMRRVERSARAHGTDREEGAAAADAIVARFVRAGLVDDRVYAEGRAGALLRRGASPRAVRAALRAKGIAPETVEAALDAADGDEGRELRAAIALARRRRLGPFRPETERAERRDRDLAALARAGFGYDVARRVVEAESADALES